MGLFTTSVRAVVGVDVIGANIGHAPANTQLASYVTGSGVVPAPASFWQQHPTAVRIDQTPAGTEWDRSADVDDFENGAVTLAELAPRAKERMASFAAGSRPGQRHPVVYASASNLTEVVNALIAGGIKSGVGLWVANWSYTEAEAFAAVLNASGPFPIEAFQFASGQFYDTDIFSEEWLTTVSGAHPAKHTASGSESLVQLAASRRMSVQGWLSLQARLAGQGAADGLGEAVPKAGTPWYTVR